MYGIVFGVGSTGALLGSIASGRSARRVGIGPAAIAAQATVGIGGLLIVAAVRIPVAALPLLVAAEFVQSFAGAIYGINRSTIIQTMSPDRLRGRIAGSGSVLGMAAVIVGSLAGGVLGESIGFGSTMTIGAAGGVVAVGWLLFSPIRKFEAS